MDATASLWKRLSGALALTVAVMMLVGLMSILFKINITSWVLSGSLFVVVFPVAYVVVSLLSRRKR